jgi:putative methanogenesis marker protein 1
MAGITLQQCPKVYILETHRSKTPDSTLRFIENTKNTVGVMALRDVTDLDRIGLPVFTCDRIRPDNSRTSHTGKGVSKTQAQVSLMMEAIERYSSEFRDEYLGRLVRGSYQQLRDDFNILDPGDLILPAFSDFRAERVLHWVWGFDLSAQEEMLVPAVAVYHPFHLDEKPPIKTNTNGLASGNTLEEAIFHGMTEVIERDAWSIAKFSNEMNAALVVEDEPAHQFLIDLIRKFENAAVEVTARDLTTDIGVPVIAAFSQDAIHPNLMPFDGFGAHLDPRVAMARALLELATTRAFFIQKHSFESLQENIPYYYSEVDWEDPRFYAREQKRLGEMESQFSIDILEDIKTLLMKLETSGLTRTIIVDLTRPDVGMPTVRVIIPGLEVYCFDRERKGERLFRS